MKRAIFYAMAATLVLASCGSSKKVPSVERPKELILNLAVLNTPMANSYINLDYGIKLKAYDVRNSKDIVKRFDANPIFVPAATTYPEVSVFMHESGRKYMRELGFILNADIETDYLLTMKLTEMNLSWFSNSGWVADVSAEISVSNSHNKQVYPAVVVRGSSSQMARSSDYAAANLAMNQAYTSMLEDIDWDRIAFFLKKSAKPSQEKNKKVSGEGNTALESTIINWYVESSPRGADVNFRVISSTPDVKNTNFKYVGTTPFESTESFDIIGLTYNNSGNIQIEVSCEKKGYLTQKKRFNLRSVLDQKEISTKFNLVKEDE